MSIRFPGRGAAAAAAAAGLAVAAAAAPSPLATPLGSDGEYLAVRALARAYGAVARVEPSGLPSLSGARHSLRFSRDGRRVYLQGVEVWLRHPLEAHQLRAGAIHRADATGLVDVAFRPQRHLAGYGAETVVLDPGHGGRDGGAVGVGGLREKDLTMELARAVRVRLAVAGLQVRLTRDDDRFVELEERPRRATALAADLFVSIHFNAAEPGSQGVETYVLTPAGSPSTRAADPRPSARYAACPANGHDAANFALGFHVQRQMTRSACAPDRGVRNARFAVLRTAPCPATLVECGFLSDPDEAARISDPAHRDRLAAGLARGILEYAMAVRRARAIGWPTP